MEDANPRIDVWSDFVCPWSFLNFLSLKKLQRSHEVNIIWHALELRSKDLPPVSDEYREQVETSQRPQFASMVRESLGVEVHPGPYGIDSRPAFTGAKYAVAQGRSDAYHEAVFRAYWQEARDISDRAVLWDIAESVGLHRADFDAALDDWDNIHAVMADFAVAGDVGVTGIPTTIIAQKHVLTGPQAYEALVDAVEQIRAKAALTTGLTRGWLLISPPTIFTN